MMYKLMNDITTLISLTIAFIAVIFGPLIQIMISKNTQRNTIKIANKQIIGPFRQNWINKLRDNISLFISKATYHYVAGTEETENDEVKNKEEWNVLKDLEFLYNDIEFLLNPNDVEHNKLLELLKGLLNEYHEGIKAETISELKIVSKKIFKNEWERIKNEN